VLSVDDHPLLREGIALIINYQSDMLLVSQASGGRRLFNSIVSTGQTLR